MRLRIVNWASGLAIFHRKAGFHPNLGSLRKAGTHRKVSSLQNLPKGETANLITQDPEDEKRQLTLSWKTITTGVTFTTVQPTWNPNHQLSDSQD
jgi:hypothetical protein